MPRKRTRPGDAATDEAISPSGRRGPYTHTHMKPPATQQSGAAVYYGLGSPELKARRRDIRARAHAEVAAARAEVEAKQRATTPDKDELALARADEALAKLAALEGGRS